MINKINDSNIINDELKDYHMMLCNNDYPKFIDSYLELEIIRKLNGIGQYCGCDYFSIYNIRYWYSRYHHSISTALITWNLTKNKKQTLAALLHDLGTPAFSHCVDFMLGDSIKQNTSEKSVKDVIENSPELIKLLKRDNLTIEDVTNLELYPIIENKTPRLCADRLDGVMPTAYIWLNKISLENTKKYYKDISILKNEDNIDEIGFNTKESAELFFEAVYLYSMELQSNTNNAILTFVADSLKVLIERKIIAKEDLYKYSEEDIIQLFEKNIVDWYDYTKAPKIISTDSYAMNVIKRTETKKRFVNPLCVVNNKVNRLSEVSEKTKQLIEKYQNYTDKEYCFFDKIEVK